jgi:hypothetical protein
MKIRLYSMQRRLYGKPNRFLVLGGIFAIQIIYRSISHRYSRRSTTLEDFQAQRPMYTIFLAIHVVY